MKNNTRIALLSIAVCLAFLAACSKKEAETKPSNEAGAMKPAAAHAGAPAAPGQPAAGAAAAAPALKWTAPAEWTSEKPTSSMRQAQYRLPKADADPEDGELLVFYFQGGGGGVQMNIDRWIGMFNKADGSTADNNSAKTTKKVVNGIPVTIVDVSGTYMAGSGAMMGGQPTAKPNFRMLAAVAEHGSGPWFFKLTGPAKTIARWEGSFTKFLDTLQ
jgi:hypothetical protein